MEIPAWYYSCVWSLIGFYFWFVGIDALDRSDLSKSVSPAVMSLFKHFLAISFCHSTTYALALRPKLGISVGRYFSWISFAVFPLFFSGIPSESFQWYFPVYSLVNLSCLLFYFLPEMRKFLFEDYLYKICIGIALFPLVYYWSPGEPSGWYMPMFVSNVMIQFNLILVPDSDDQSGLLMHFAAVSWLFFFGGKSKYFPLLAVSTGFFTSAVSAAVSGDERFQEWLPEYAIAATREHRYFLKLKKMMKDNGKAVEFAIGMAGTILFQNFFRPASFEDVLAFLYLAVAWLANLALLLADHDLGIFNFFLSNVIVGCTVSQFGLRVTTWLAYAACVLLFLLRQKLESLTVVTSSRNNRELVVVWRDKERTTMTTGAEDQGTVPLLQGHESTVVVTGDNNHGMVAVLQDQESTTVVSGDGNQGTVAVLQNHESTTVVTGDNNQGSVTVLQDHKNTMVVTGDNEQGMVALLQDHESTTEMTQGNDQETVTMLQDHESTMVVASEGNNRGVADVHQRTESNLDNEQNNHERH